MNLIEEILIDGVVIRFFDGIDFDRLIEHPKNGRDGFIFCFMDSWTNEVKNYNRNNKLKSIINNTTYVEFEWDEINNNYISIYQSDGVDKFDMYQTIRKKVERKQFDMGPWIPVGGIDNGMWKIQTGKNDD